ncbi:MAG: response regulator [Holosporales bacterium]|jgi:CheY-like chemotaxis protein|nr:response regulator [Holosporales bacterium]
MRSLTLSSIDKFIGKQLREKRLKRGMTLSYVASKVGLSYQQIQKYEQSITKVSAATLYKLSALYDVGIEKFFEGISLDVGIYDNSRKKFDQEAEEINILMVEDNPADEITIRKALKDFENLNILCVHDGIQVFQVLRYKTLCTDFQRPDIIFLDLFIPRREGLNVLKEIKRDRETQDIPIVVVTSSINQELIDKAYKAGASGYIRKSFDFSSFRSDIINCVKYWTEVVTLPTKAR